MKTAYIDMIGGASGDMLLGALLDAGLPLDDLLGELAKLPEQGYRVRPERVQRGALNATLAHVELDEEGSRRRTWEEFSAAIRESSLEAGVREAALQTLDALTDAEARVHGVDRHHLQPHELGTVDTLVDIVGVIAGLRLLGVEHVHASTFPAGVGFVRSEHGRIPATAPATAQIYAASGAPVRSPAQTPDGALPYGECVTPTGAALVATIASFERSETRVSSVGYGAGSRDPVEYPNVVALWLGEAQQAAAPGPLRKAGGLTLLETNIDDMGGELFGYVQERLFEAGALDVWMSPIQMKKSRPAVMLSALVRDADADTAAGIIMRETSTLGLRARPVQRYEADRESASVEVPGLGNVRVKVKMLDGQVSAISPEYESCRELALRHGMPLAEVMRLAAAEAWRTLGSS